LRNALFDAVVLIFQTIIMCRSPNQDAFQFIQAWWARNMDTYTPGTVYNAPQAIAKCSYQKKQ